MSDLQTQIVKGITGFSWNLFKAARLSEENYLISPHSVCSALMLACLGAKGNTEGQIFKAIGVSDTASDDIHTAYSGVNENLKKSCREAEGVEINVANKLFAGDAMKVVELYVKESERLYASGIETLDFAGKPEESRKTINKWVEEQTKEKIKDLLKEGSIGSDTNLVLTNAVYFKGKWGKPFQSENTAKKTFHSSSTATVEVDMMHKKLDLRYLEDGAAKFKTVAIPYQHNLFSMVIIRPDDLDGLSAVEESLDAENITSLIKNLQQAIQFKVELNIPKFTFKKQSDLSRILPKLGVEDLFNMTKADLSGMTENSGVAISDVIHEAFIDVNEEGTEAAAATAMISRMMMLPMDEVPFVCDRPFLFMIIDNVSGLVLFIGRYMKP